MKFQPIAVLVSIELMNEIRLIYGICWLHLASINVAMRHSGIPSIIQFNPPSFKQSIIYCWRQQFIFDLLIEWLDLMNGWNGCRMLMPPINVIQLQSSISFQLQFQLIWLDFRIDEMNWRNSIQFRNSWKPELIKLAEMDWLQL